MTINAPTRASCPTQCAHFCEAHVRGEQHEEQPDQEQGNLIFEFAQVPIHAGLDVAHDYACDGHGENSALRDELVAALEDAKDGGQREDVLEALRDDAANAEQPGQQEPREQTEDGAEPESEEQPESSAGQWILPGRQAELEHHHGKQSADRVDQDALGLEHRGHPRAQPQLFDTNGPMTVGPVTTIRLPKSQH